MKYVAHREYNGDTLTRPEKTIQIPKGATLELNGEILYYDGEAVCLKNSYYGHRYFARDDDGRGLERGELTYKIAFEPRFSEGTGFRFSDEERKIICDEYSHWLKKKIMVILFNNDFFAADVDELQKFADRIFGGAKCTESKTATEK